MGASEKLCCFCTAKRAGVGIGRPANRALMGSAVSLDLILPSEQARYLQISLSVEYALSQMAKDVKTANQIA